MLPTLTDLHLSSQMPHCTNYIVSQLIIFISASVKINGANYNYFLKFSINDVKSIPNLKHHENKAHAYSGRSF